MTSTHSHLVRIKNIHVIICVSVFGWLCVQCNTTYLSAGISLRPIIMALRDPSYYNVIIGLLIIFHMQTISMHFAICSIRDWKRNISLLTSGDDVNYVATSKSLVLYDATENGHVDVRLKWEKSWKLFQFGKNVWLFQKKVKFFSRILHANERCGVSASSNTFYRG